VGDEWEEGENEDGGINGEEKRRGLE